MNRPTTVRLFVAMLAAGAAEISGAVWTVLDPGPVPFLLTAGWQLIFVGLAVLLVLRGRA